MAERAGSSDARTSVARAHPLNTAAQSARQRFNWILSRESLLRLGLSVVLATALWLYVTSKQDPTQAWDYATPLTVTAQNVQNGLTVANNLPSVHVRIQADRNTTPVSPASFHTFVDLSNDGRGLHTAKVIVIADPGIQVVGVTPAHIHVLLDSVTERHVPINLHIYNQPPEGYTAQVVKISPSTVTVSGPVSQVSAVSHASVYISLAEAKSSVSGLYKLTLEDRNNVTLLNRLITSDPSQVEVTIAVKPLSSFTTLPVVASITGQPRSGFGVVGVTVHPAEITARGKANVLSQVQSVSTQPISVQGHGAGVVTQRVRLKLPRGVSAPVKRLTVKVEIRPVAGSTSTEIGVTPRAVTAGLAAHVHPGKVLVTLVGPSPDLPAAANQIRAYIDLTGYGAGTYRVRPSITTPSDERVESVFPGTVTVTLAPAG